MPGRPDFSTAGSQGSGQTVAVQSRPEMELVDADQTDTVAAGANETIEIYAPVGSVYHVLGVEITIGAPSNATTGDHEIKLNPLGSNIEASQAAWNYADEALLSGFEWTGAKSFTPADNIVGAVQSLKATENQPIQILYRNRTDADQTGTRYYRLYVKEVSF